MRNHWLRVLLGALLGLHVAGAALSAATSGLEGAWRFVGEVNLRSDGSVVDVGTQGDYDGFLIYTPDGFMSVTLMPKGRKWTIAGASLAELRETIEVGTAYAGRYEVDSVAHTVTHIVSVILDPGVEGARLVRRYSLHGDTLELSGTWPYKGETLQFTLKWVRVT